MKTHIMIHHSATTDGRSYSWSAIERYHRAWAYQGHIIQEEEGRELLRQGKTVKRPWSDIGYHYGVELIGDDFACLVGRPLHKLGAHCVGWNSKAIGICCVGNYDREVPAERMIEVLCRRLLIPLMAVFPLRDEVVYHRDYAEKSCPGKLFTPDIIPGMIARLK